MNVKPSESMSPVNPAVYADKDVPVFFQRTSNVANSDALCAGYFAKKQAGFLVIPKDFFKPLLGKGRMHGCHKFTYENALFQHSHFKSFT